MLSLSVACRRLLCLVVDLLERQLGGECGSGWIELCVIMSWDHNLMKCWRFILIEKNHIMLLS